MKSIISLVNAIEKIKTIGLRVVLLVSACVIALMAASYDLYAATCYYEPSFISNANCQSCITGQKVAKGLPCTYSSEDSGPFMIYCNCGSSGCKLGGTSKNCRGRTFEGGCDNGQCSLNVAQTGAWTGTFKVHLMSCQAGG